MSEAMTTYVFGTINGFGFGSICNIAVSREEHLARIRKHFETVTIREMTVNEAQRKLTGFVPEDDSDE